MFFSENIFNDKYVFQPKKYKSCSKQPLEYNDSIYNKIYQNKNQIKIKENSLTSEKKHYETDSVKNSEFYFKQKKKLDLENAIKNEKVLKEFYVSYNKKTKSIFKEQEKIIKLKKVKNLYEKENIKLEKKEEKTNSNQIITKLIAKAEQDQINYFSLNIVDKKQRKFLKKKDNFLEIEKMEKIRKNRKMNYEEFQNMMKKEIIKKTLARRERLLFNKLNEELKDKNKKIFRLLPAQNYFVGNQKLDIDNFIKNDNIKNNSFYSPQKIIENVNYVKNLQETLKTIIK